MAQESLPTPDLARLKIARGTAKPSGGGSGKYFFLVFLLACGGVAYWQRDRFMPKPAEGASESAPRTVVVRESGGVDGAGVAANGYVVARRKAALSTILPGRLVELNVEEGTEVVADQIVARIQFDDFQSQVAEAEAAHAVAIADVAVARTMLTIDERRLAEAEAAVLVTQRSTDESIVDAENMRREMERQRASRRDSGDLSESEWDRMESTAKVAASRTETARARIAAAETAVASARAQIAQRKSEILRLEAAVKRAATAVESAKIVLEKTVVRAPFSGTIVRKEAEQGEVVAATGFGNSRGSVATLVDMATLEVQVELTEKNLGSITNDSLAFIALDVDPSKRWPGRVRQVWPVADRSKGTIELRIVFIERPPRLRPEMGVRVDFPAKTAESRPSSELLVAAAAVRPIDGKSIVFVVRDGVVRRTEITVGERRGSDVVVLSGLSRGERVVFEPANNLADGDRFQDERK